MKKSFLLIGLISLIVYSCDQPVSTPKPIDIRPISQIDFIAHFENFKTMYDESNNAVTKDSLNEAFAKYADLKTTHIKDWVMIIDEINDYKQDHASYAYVESVMQPIYNIKMLNLNNESRINFTATITKNAKDTLTKSLIKSIKNLSKGDTVIVSGDLYSKNNVDKTDYSYHTGVLDPIIDFKLIKLAKRR